MERLTLIAEHDGFIQSIPIAHTVTKSLIAGSCVFNKVGYNVFGEPAAILILQEEWCVPMIQGRHGGYVIFYACVDHIIIMMNTSLVDRSSSEW